ncbi:MAG TPA: DUF892 family protein [Lacibacter sp.]|nr:DUF892 family protein [Lacibacter sp.]
MLNEQAISTLHHLLDYDAQKFTSAEVLLKNSLKDWIQTASSPMLKTVLQKYLSFTEEHIERLEKFYEDEKISSLSTTNRVMYAFIAETTDKLNHCTDKQVADACLLACIQSINHFKISIYGTAAAYANTLEMTGHAELFHEAEVNEKQIDDRLSQLAQYDVNIKAKSPIVVIAH